jgi:hypothetical protein
MFCTPRETVTIVGGHRARNPTQGTFMRMFTILVAALSVIAVTACSPPPADDSAQPHRGQAGPYIGGSGGFGY